MCAACLGGRCPTGRRPRGWPQAQRKLTSGPALRAKGVLDQMASKPSKRADERDEEASERGDAMPEHTVAPARRRPVVLVAVIICSVIMVGSILLPSLSAIVSGATRSSSANTAAASTSAADASSTEAATTATSYMDTLDGYYEPKATQLEDRLSEDSSDTAALINLANTYYTWGTTAASYVSSGDDQQHATDLLTKAMDAYDKYLEHDDAAAARTSRAMCQYYLGDVDGAKAALEELTGKVSSYAPAWVDLGTIYEAAGDTQSATSAYNKALEVDPGDTYGVKSTATSKLSALTSAATTGSATTDATETTGDAGSDAAADNSVGASDASATTAATN